MAVISIIIPAFNEEDNIIPLHARFSAISAPSHTFEFILVDDGSSDNTFGTIENLSRQDPRVKAIRFSRNFGSHAACLAGLAHSSGDACIFISADMQEPPELILDLIRKWQEGFDTVIGIREGGQSPATMFSRFYYYLVRKFALPNMPKRGTDVFLVDRKVVNTVVSMQERNTSIFGLILWSGFRQAFVSYHRGQRDRGVSKWTLPKKIKLFVDTFVSFSFFPIRLISLFGFFVALAGFFYALYIIYHRIISGAPVEGWASLMVVLLLVSGIQLLMLGVIGEYLWRSFDETRRRPPFIVAELLGLQPPE
ncbi:MAG: dolichol-phosphate mannosyltransferase [Nitrospirae bacterium]|nr:MAG: dolichol-phosphate mannosyltransferase [Nitrospirota bacterium]